MNNEVVKEALSYELSAFWHDKLRRILKEHDDIVFEPAITKITKSKDEVWNIKHGTDNVDIANCTFDELPSNLQDKLLKDVREVINKVFDPSSDDVREEYNKIFDQSPELKKLYREGSSEGGSIMIYILITGESMLWNCWTSVIASHKASHWISNEILKHPISKDDLGVLISTVGLVVFEAGSLVRKYFQGEINIEEICKQYNIDTNLPEKRKLNKH